MSFSDASSTSPEAWDALVLAARHDRELAALQLAEILRERKADALARASRIVARRRARIDYLAVPIDSWPLAMRNVYYGRSGEPAEALPADQRHALVRYLHRRGLTDDEVAARLRMTTYTAARIRRDVLGLPCNVVAVEAVAA